MLRIIGLATVVYFLLQLLGALGGIEGVQEKVETGRKTYDTVQKINKLIPGD